MRGGRSRVLSQRDWLACAVSLALAVWCDGAHAGPEPRLSVSVVPSDGTAGLQVRVQRSDNSEPDLIWSGTAQPAPYRLVLAWAGPAALERPLPATSDVGVLQSVALHTDGNRASLELALRESVVPRLRRIGDAWVLQLAPDPDAPAPAPPSAPVAVAAVVAPRAVVPRDQPFRPPQPPAPMAAASSVPPAAAPNRRQRSRGEDLLLDLSVNGLRQPNVARAEQTAEGEVLVASDSWVEARLLPPGPARELHDGTPAYPLDAVPGLTYRVDRSALSLVVEAPAQAFATASIGPSSATGQAPPRPDPGVVVNYDLSLAKASRSTAPTGGAAIEAVGFGPAGTVVGSAVARDTGTERTVARLETYWRYDMPDRMETLVIGDAVGVGGAWSRPVRFGGLRWGRDFSMRPGFVTMPQPSLRGEATVPSTVDVLVNNARRISQRVEPGPFDLSNVPIVAGAGEVNLVVRDLLGRETVVTQSYYATPRLLAAGLSDFSVEAGWLRTGFGQDSEYGAPFAAGTLRRGLTSGLTGEARLEVQRLRQAAGFELATLLGTWGAARLALAHSASSLRGQPETGQTLQAGMERNTAAGGFAVQYEQASRGFAPLGESTALDAQGQRVRRRWAATVGTRLFGRLSGGLNFLRQDRWDGETVSSLGLSLGFPLGSGSLSLSLLKRLDDASWSAGVFLTLPLGNQIQGGSRIERLSGGELLASASAARNPPAGPGLGWRVEASTQESQRARASLQYNSPYALSTADLAADKHGRLDARVGARGSVGVAGGMAFASRPVGEGSFAIVQVPDTPGVPVRLSNQVVAETDSRGFAFVPGLLAWQKNRIEVDPAELPLDTDVAAPVQEVVPYARSGSVLRFDVKRSRRALLVLLQPDGKPVPVGARVRLLPGGREFPVANRGEAWLEDLAAERQRVEVAWQGGGCQLDLVVPAAVAGTPDRLGPLVCGQEIQR
jgi:outer membrane usher protein